MLRKVEVVALILFLGLAPAVFADQITLKNGDRLTGTVVKSDGKSSGAAHRLRGRRHHTVLPRSRRSRPRRNCTSAPRISKTVVGPVTAERRKTRSRHQDGGPVEVPAANVVLIRNDAEQAAYEKSLHPGLLHGWNGGVERGLFAGPRQQRNENLALAINAVHPTLNDKITMYLSSIYTDEPIGHSQHGRRH